MLALNSFSFASFCKLLLFVKIADKNFWNSARNCVKPVNQKGSFYFRICSGDPETGGDSVQCHTI